MSDDAELLTRYARGKNEEAFSEVVRRYVDLVYSAALRQVRDAHLAEDITQIVFLRLARKADSLPKDVVLAGWLHADTRLTALQTLRTERRRAAREEAVTMEHEKDEWAAVRPVVDEALGELDPPERDALLLRFFGDRSFADVAAALRVTPDAARMRVNRALEKLRDLLEKRGIKTTAAALGAALLANGLQAAPVAISAKVLATVARGSATAPVAAGQTFFAKGVIGLGIAAALVLGIFILRTQFQKTVPAGVNPPIETAAAPSASDVASPVTAQVADTSGTTKGLKLKVIDGGSGAGLPGVKVQVRTFSDLLRGKNDTLETAEDGAVQIIFPTVHERDFHHQLTLSKDGYVARYVSWSVFQRDTIDDIPAEYVATMDRGIEIGGVVRDPSGQGIDMVNIVFTGPSPVGVPPRERDTTMGNYHTETTDASGRWHCNHIRPDLREISFRLEHPRYRGVTYACSGNDHPQSGYILLPEADYLAKRAEMRMEPGILLGGTVVDSAGQPISGAKVNRNRDWIRKNATITTGAQGEFAFHDIEAGSVMLGVQAQSFAPETRTVEVTGDLDSVRFELSPSIGLRGHVADEAGLPVANAEVSVASDDRHRDLYRWSARTDDLGTFLWDSSPNTAITLNVFAYGFQRTNVTLRPGNEVRTITLLRAAERNLTSLKIRVVDAETEKPVNAEIYVNENQFQLAGKCIDGVYTFKTFEGDSGFQFEARARGYSPERTGRLNIKTNSEIKLALRKGSYIEGIVLSPSGEPVKGVDVALCTEEKGAIIAGGRLAYLDNSILTQTDENGRFRHMPVVGAHTLCAIHAAGFAMVRLSAFENGSTLPLRAWGRIVGAVTINGELARNVELGAFTSAPNGNERGLNLNSYMATSDNEGRFVFENLPPVEVKLGWMIANGRGKAFSHSMPVHVEPGADTPVQFVIGGRTVKGRFKFNQEPEIDWSERLLNASLNVDQGPPPFQTATAGQDEASRRRIYTEFWESEAGREWDRKNQGFGIQVNRDGTFEATAVPPGRYTLSASIGDKTPGKYGIRMPTAMLRESVTVPEGGDPFDLGEFVVKGREPVAR